MPDGIIPPFMEDVAKAGGWDERALEVLKEMKSIKKEEWGLIHENLKTLKGFIDMDAQKVLSGFDDMADSLKTTISLKISELLSPIQNEITSLLNAALEPILKQFSPIVNNLTALVGDNAIGSTVGALSGAVIGAFIGSPAIGAMIGGILGALLEQYFGDRYNILDPPAVPPGVMMTYSQFEQQWIHDHPFEIVPRLALPGMYQQYVDEWTASHTYILGLDFYHTGR